MARACHSACHLRMGPSRPPLSSRGRTTWSRYQSGSGNPAIICGIVAQTAEVGPASIHRRGLAGGFPLIWPRMDDPWLYQRGSGYSRRFYGASEKSAKSKADLVKGLKDSVAKCDDVYGKTDAANALSLVKAGKGDALRGMILLDNVSHDNEHYGNIVTYMRLKGHVPPSTARTQRTQ